MSLPFFEILTRLLPSATLDLVAKTSVREIFRHHPAIHTIHSFSKADVSGIRGLYRFGKSLQIHGPYDLFMTLPDSFSSALIGYSTGSRMRVGHRGEWRSWLLTHPLPRRIGMHRARSYLYLLQEFAQRLSKQEGFRHLTEALPFAEQPQQITFPFAPDEGADFFATLPDETKCVVFNVNSEAPSRRLPGHTWIALGRKLLHSAPHAITLVFIGTVSEQARVAEVIEGIGMPERIMNVAGKTSLRDLARLLRDADVVVSNDSGPMHLANAVNTPLITFIGAADPRETAPFNQERTVILNKHLPCSPCVKNSCKFSTVRCLEAIHADEIYKQVLAFLNP